MKTTCKKSWPVNLNPRFRGFCILVTTEVVAKVFTNLNVVAHLVVPASWGSCLPRLFLGFMSKYCFNFNDNIKYAK